MSNGRVLAVALFSVAAGAVELGRNALEATCIFLTPREMSPRVGYVFLPSVAAWTGLLLTTFSLVSSTCSSAGTSLRSSTSATPLLAFVGLLPISDRRIDFSGAGGGKLGRLGSGRSCDSTGGGGLDVFAGGVGANGMVAVEPLLTVSLREGGRELRDSERDFIVVGWSTDFFLSPLPASELPGSFTTFTSQLLDLAKQ